VNVEGLGKWLAVGVLALPRIVLADGKSEALQKNSGLEEVVVTATKQTESIDKVPISLTALTQAQMDSKGIRTVDDVVRQTPGIDFSRSPFGGGLGSNIAVRGILSTTGASTTGVYIDDIPIQSRANQENFIGATFPQVFDLERVEVLRGPQGTLWGAGAEGGAIRFITPDPGLKTYSGYARAEVASTEHGDPSYEAGAAVGGPILQDQLGFRVSAWYRRDGGYVDRVNQETDATDNNTNYQDSYVVRGALAWNATDHLQLTPSIFFQNLRLNDTSSIWESLSNVDQGVLRNGHVLQEPTRDQFYLPALKARWELGAVDLTSVTSYFSRHERNLADDTNFESVIWTGIPYPIFPGQNAPAFVGTSQDIFSQELRAQSHDPDAMLTWTVGAFYSDAHERDYNYVQDLYFDALIQNATGLNAGQLFGIPLTDGKYTFVGTTVSHDEQTAAFGQVDYHIVKGLTLTVGLRVAHTRFDFVQGYAGPVNYSGSGPDAHTVVGGQSETPVTPKVGLSYQLTDRNMVYFSAGEGYRIGGANSPVPLNPACRADLGKLGLTASPLEYQSDKTWSYEVGFKGRGLDDHLEVQASAFHIDWKNIQQYVGLPDCGGIGFTANLGTAVSNGFDLQLSARPVAGLLLSGSVGYTDAKYSKTIGSNGTTIVNEGDTVGSPPLGTTPWVFDASAQYDFGIGSRDFYVRVDDTYRSHQSGQSANRNDPTALGYDPDIPFDPATNLLNVRLGTSMGGADVSVFVNNVLNSQPLLQRTHDIPGSPLYYDLTFRPLTAGATVSYRF
jgi:outer membrane receptor protein involved in Fe transport